MERTVKRVQWRVIGANGPWTTVATRDEARREAATLRKMEPARIVKVTTYARPSWAQLATAKAVHEAVALERDGLEKDVATLTEALAASRAGHEKTRAELDIARSDRELWKGRVEGMRRAVGEMPPCGATHPGGSPRRCEIAAGHPGMHWDRGGLWPVGETTGGPDVWDNVPDGEGEHR
jgi:hypothetical protein